MSTEGEYLHHNFLDIWNAHFFAELADSLVLIASSSTILYNTYCVLCVSYIKQAVVELFRSMKAWILWIIIVSKTMFCRLGHKEASPVIDSA